MFIWKELQVLEALREETGQRLIKAAVVLQTEHMKRLNVFNPPPLYLNPAPIGEYPHKRTGFLQGHILYQPTSANQVMKEGRIRVGYAKSASYGAWLEIKGWKGIWDTATDIRRQLAMIVGEGFGLRSHGR